MLAVASTLLALAIYGLVRINPPEWLSLAWGIRPHLAGYAWLAGSAPAFLYSLTIGLLLAICTSTPEGARRHCMIWVALAMCLEVSQHPLLAEPLVSGLTAIGPLDGWRWITSYWMLGTFDWFDLVATVLGGALAFAVFALTSGGNTDVPSN